MSPAVALALVCAGAVAGAALALWWGRRSRTLPVPPLPEATGGPWLDESLEWLSLEWWEPWGEDPDLPAWLDEEGPSPEPLATPESTGPTDTRRARIAAALRRP